MLFFLQGYYKSVEKNEHTLREQGENMSMY